MKRSLLFLAVLGLLLFPATGASAHEHREVGDHEVVVGWLDEPAYAGVKNAVQFMASHGKEPVKDADLEVEVIFGPPESQERTAPMPLEPAWGSPGEYHAYVIPTEPGTYSFRVFGTLGHGEEFDETFTSGEDTFGDIHDPAEIEFPPVVSSKAQGEPEPAEAAGAASPWMPVAATVIAAIALVLAVVALMRKRA